MTQVIIYKQNNGIAAVVMPTEEAITQLGLHEIALKDVPAGQPFKFVAAAALPNDWPQETWDADLSEPDGYGIGQAAWFIKQYRAEIAAIEAEAAPAQPEALVALTFEKIVEANPDEPEDDLKAAYAAYLAEVEAINAQAMEQHAKAVEEWQASKMQRIAQLNAQIEAIEKELAA